MMNDLRRGNPKKRFLWRRLLPPLDESSGSREDNTNDKETAKLKTAFHHDRKREKQFDFQVEVDSPVVSLPTSEEEEESTSVSTTASSSQPQQLNHHRHHIFRRVSSEELKSDSTNDFLKTEPLDPGITNTSASAPSAPTEAALTTPSGPSMGEVPFQRPFLASMIDYTRRTYPPEESESQSNSESLQTSEKKMPCSEIVETDDTSSLVVSTAASVLLLMRFSVSEQALTSLARYKKPSVKRKDTKDDAPKSNLKTDHKPDIKPPLEATSSSSRLVTPESTVKPCISRLVSMPAQDSTPVCPKRLAMPEDPNELNSLHCFVRAHLLEVFSLPPQKDKPGRVGLRCVFCSHLPRKDRSGTTMCTFYPKSLQDLYRSVMTWQRIHFRGCKHANPKIKQEYWKHKESDQTRGKTTYWVTSAMRLGLQDINNGRNGICYVCPSSNQ